MHTHDHPRQKMNETRKQKPTKIRIQKLVNSDGNDLVKGTDSQDRNNNDDLRVTQRQHSVNKHPRQKMNETRKQKPTKIRIQKLVNSDGNDLVRGMINRDKNAFDSRGITQSEHPVHKQTTTHRMKRKRTRTLR
jgi:hypothetical protein